MKAFFLFYLILNIISLQSLGYPQLPKYCSLKKDINSYNIKILRSSGDKNLDKSLNLELQHIAKIFPVLPGFVFFDDANGKNAFAMTETMIKGTRGTVIFGKGLLSSELNSHKWGGLAVAGIIAHEFAHIYQFQHDNLYNILMKNQKTGKLVELHADYLAGYYLGLKRLRTPKGIDIKAFADSLYLKGDNYFNTLEHHGTPKERMKVMIEGYKQGLKNNRNINYIAKKGLIFVKNI
jgi:hypothetical protein